jgi:hypothetical protein
MIKTLKSILRFVFIDRLGERQEQENKELRRKILSEHGLEFQMSQSQLEASGFKEDIICMEHALGTGAGIPGTEKIGYAKQIKPDLRIIYEKREDGKYHLFKLYYLKS